MLPISPWSIDQFNFAHEIIPSLYLSGDFVDYFRVDERRGEDSPFPRELPRVG